MLTRGSLKVSLSLHSLLKIGPFGDIFLRSGIVGTDPVLVHDADSFQIALLLNRTDQIHTGLIRQLLLKTDVGGQPFHIFILYLQNRLEMETLSSCIIAQRISRIGTHIFPDHVEENQDAYCHNNKKGNDNKTIVSVNFFSSTFFLIAALPLLIYD